MCLAENLSPVKLSSSTEFVMDGCNFCINPDEAEALRDAMVAVAVMMQIGKSRPKENHAHAES